MGLDFSGQPTDLFHMPSIHAGVHYALPPTDWLMRPVPGADVHLFAASDSDPILELQQSAIDRQQQRIPGSVMEIASASVVLSGAEFRGLFATVQGRMWLNGVQGDRLRHRFQPLPGESGDLRAAFRSARDSGEYCPPVWEGDAATLDVALAMGHGAGHPAALVGLMSDLAHVAQDGSDRMINLHVPSLAIRHGLVAMIAAIFPTLLPRLRFHSGARRYGAVRSVFNHRHYLYQVQDSRIRRANLAQAGWQRPGSTARQRAAVAGASYDSGLRLLREAALRRIPAPMNDPSLIWLTPGPDAPALTGHEPLLEGLRGRGFRSVQLADKTPLQRIAALQSAEVIVAPYGTGLGDMAFVRPGTLVLSLETHRVLHDWADLLPLAHVAQCRYYTVLGDMAGGRSPDDLPPRSAPAALHLGRRAISRILGLIDRDRQERRRPVCA
ncbi:glycosyltransferase 61 family protein [Paracoccus laeviglucosivorans]|uniref:Capsular polysaccharide biosynthesis protein n=1 Tax=Paracoccus laeviglucosivorans TaxID=1197861 RepID=A0A521DAJ5_9RHOB|nr:glycosyltransferase 61 family protein [Paracoccus laeviglucosivorans]SMO68678.1 Protein of unknown function [Paracoccus laeviglucosivorans]